MRRKKERSKQGQTNKQGKATQHTQGSHFPIKNELPQVGLEPTTLYTNKQTRQSNTAHPRQSLFLEKMSCLRWDSNPQTLYTLYSRQSALPTELPRQLSWLGPNLTSHSTPDEQANHQLSMKEKAGVMKPPMTPNTKPSIY